MVTNNCPSCGARNTLKSNVCGNCGADITHIGKLKYNIKNIVIFVVVISLFLIFGGNGN